jgi:hypothetical protein
MKRLTALTLGALTLTGCLAAEEVVAPAPEAVGQTQVSDLPADHPAVGQLATLSRGPRRMSVDQLERSLDRVANAPLGSVKLPPDLAVTLGKPDFIRATEESLEPSPLFMKFMMDLGAIICTNIGDSDPARPAEERVYTRYLERDDNLAYMLVRFTGIEGDDAAPYMARLQRVYEVAAGSPRPLAGYEAACLALFTSPEFLLY